MPKNSIFGNFQKYSSSKFTPRNNYARGLLSQADVSQIQISGSIDANYLMGIFTGIVIAVVGFLGITRGRQDTPGQPTPG